MAGDAPKLPTGWARARRDLIADWRRWSIAERISALAAGAALAIVPVLGVGGLVLP